MHLHSLAHCLCLLQAPALTCPLPLPSTGPCTHLPTGILCSQSPTVKSTACSGLCRFLNSCTMSTLQSHVQQDAILCSPCVHMASVPLCSLQATVVTHQLPLLDLSRHEHSSEQPPTSDDCRQLVSQSHCPMCLLQGHALTCPGSIFPMEKPALSGPQHELCVSSHE